MCCSHQLNIKLNPTHLYQFFPSDRNFPWTQHSRALELTSPSSVRGAHSLLQRRGRSQNLHRRTSQNTAHRHTHHCHDPRAPGSTFSYWAQDPNWCTPPARFQDSVHTAQHSPALCPFTSKSHHSSEPPKCPFWCIYLFWVFWIKTDCSNPHLNATLTKATGKPESTLHTQMTPLIPNGQALPAALCYRPEQGNPMKKAAESQAPLATSLTLHVYAGRVLVCSTLSSQYALSSKDTFKPKPLMTSHGRKFT